MDTRDKWTVGLSSAALIVSISSVIFSWITYNFNVSTQSRTLVQSQIESYNKAYQDAADAGFLVGISDPFVSAGYDKAGTDLKRQSQIAAGRLVSVIDTMVYVEDRRAKRWIGFLKGMSGPLTDTHFDVADYAAEARTLRAIEESRRELGSR